MVRILLATAVAAALTAGAGSAGAQAKRATVAGTVTDTAGHPIVGARVEIVDTDIRSTSDLEGRYLLPGVWPGPVTLRVRRVGFTPETVSVTTTAGDTTRTNLTLGALVVQLAPTEVDADPSRGKMGAFNERRARGVGAFVTRAEIEKWQPASLTEMLRHVPGVGVAQQPSGEPQPVRMQRSAATTVSGVCSVLLYVDGHPYPNGNVDDFPPQTVEGLEVYRSASEIPASFRTRDATCGVIAIWTRDPEAARRQP